MEFLIICAVAVLVLFGCASIGTLFANYFLREDELRPMATRINNEPRPMATKINNEQRTMDN